MTYTRKSLALGMVAGTVWLVAWGMLFWSFLAPPLGMFHTLPEAAQVTDVLVRSQAPTGTYFMPWPRDTPEAFDAFVAQHKSGPFFKLSYIREGVDPQSPGKLLTGLVHYLTVSGLAVMLLWLAGPGPGRKRVALVFLAGAIGSNFITIADPVWFHLPWDHARGELLYELVSWLGLGLVLAAIVRPR